MGREHSMVRGETKPLSSCNPIELIPRTLPHLKSVYCERPVSGIH